MAGAAHASDLWHRSLEDLLQVIESGVAAVPGPPFVITLRIATTRMAPPWKGLPHLDRLHVYQLVRSHEGSTQFQLRLGIIESDLQADAILASVRQHYPTAMRESAEDADRAAVASAVRAARSVEPLIGAAEAAAPLVPVVPKSLAAAAPAAPEVLESPRWNIDELLPNLAEPEALRRERTPPHRPAPQIRAERAPAPAMKLGPDKAHKPPAAAAPGEAATTLPTAPDQIEAAQEATRARAVGGAPPRPVTVPQVATAVRLPINLRRPDLAAALRPDRQPRRPDPVAQTKPQPFTAAEAVAMDTVRAHNDRAIASGMATGVVTAGLSIASAAKATGDSEALQSLVEKIGTLIETVEANQERALRRQATASPAEIAIAQAASSEHSPVSPSQVSPSKAATLPNPTPLASTPARIPMIDSTQTVRALTPLELADSEASQWFAIQLMLSEEQIDAEQIPKLDIFEEYRLYSITGLDQERIVHALRAGFFSSQVAADAVAGYLAAYFAAPTVKRVSIAERERFAEQRVAAGKDVGAAGKQTAIEVVCPSALPERAVEASPSEGDKRSAPETGSLWSRLVARAQR